METSYLPYNTEILKWYNNKKKLFTLSAPLDTMIFCGGNAIYESAFYGHLCVKKGQHTFPLQSSMRTKALEMVYLLIMLSLMAAA